MNNLAPPATTKTEFAIMIVEDHPVVLEGLRSLIEQATALTICAEATQAKAVVPAAIKNQPDVIVLDLLLGGRDGLELIKELKKKLPSTKILVFTMHEESIYAERALKAGASGYLMKHEGGEKIIDGIRQVLEGELYVSHTVAGNYMQKSLRSSHRENKHGLESLSDRELHVFRLIGNGRTTRQISDELEISVKTVESHRENIKNKLSLDNSTALIRSATLWVQEQES